MWKIAAGVGLGLLSAGAVGLWLAGRAAEAKLARTVVLHEADFPVPMPSAGGEADALAKARARGAHLVEARYACTACHGRDFGGGVMVDDPAMGRILGPNLTAGRGGKTARYGPSDWDAIVRHGVKPDGHPALMPSDDFAAMSDRELSDIVAYIQGLPPIDREVEPVSLGPVARVLLALGKLPLSADAVPDHHAPHLAEPPSAEPTGAFGEHLARVCVGCHRGGLEGGPIPIGPPDWPPASNLTPSQEGLGAWTFEQFAHALREGRRPDGTRLRAPMLDMRAYARHMTDVELQALWAYLREVPARPTGS